MSVTCRWYIEPQSRKYADGLEAVELYLCREYEGQVAKPASGKRAEIVLITETGRYLGGLRTYPGTGNVYVSPDLKSDPGGEKVSLARVLKESGVEPRQEIELVMEGGVLKFGTT